MKTTHILPPNPMGSLTRTRLLGAAFCLSLCGLGVTAGAQKLAQAVPDNRVVIIDNDSPNRDVPGFSQQGWVLTPANAHPLGYNGDTAYLNSAAQPRASLAKAQWTFTGLEGRYAFYATWGELKEGDPKAPYMLSTKDVIVYADQTKAAPVQIDGRGWLELGTADLKKAMATTVVLSSGGKGFTLADAVMAKRVDVPATPSVPTTPTIPTVPAATCGNGVIETGEQCDDGNNRPTDSCHKCAVTACGDGIVQPLRGEECDEGSMNGQPLDKSTPTYGCDKTACIVAFCGDQHVSAELGEQCDDGNDNNRDGCTNACKSLLLVNCGYTTKDGAWRCDQDMVDGDCVKLAGAAFYSMQDCQANAPKYACNDGVDNDADGTVDMNDKGCANAQDQNEGDGATNLALRLGTSVPNATRGGSVYVTASLSNDGPDIATNVVVTTNIPAGMNFDSAESVPYCVQRDRTVVCTVPVLKLEAMALGMTFKVDAAAACPANLTFSAQISPSPRDANASDNAASAVLGVTCPAASCVDTDGENYDSKGKVSGSSVYKWDPVTLKNVPAEVYDYCDGSTIYEARCAEQCKPGDVCNYFNTKTCPYGCADGACKPKPVTTTQCVTPAATGAAGQNQQLTVDVNGDGAGTQQDITDQIAYYNSKEPAMGKMYDVDGSGTFDVQDILYVINYVRCMQLNPPTTTEPNASIRLTGAALSCEGGASQFRVTYATTGISGGFLQLLSPEGALLSQNQFNANASSVTVNPPPAGIVPGTSVKVCAASNGALCSGTLAVTGAACAATTEERVSLSSVVIATENGVQVGKVTYEKNFDTCAHLTDTSYQVLHKQNHFCQNSGTVTVPLSAGLNIKEGDKVYLCHGNKKGSVCSALTTVTKAAAPVDSVSLAGVAMSCRDGKDYVTVQYKKNFTTCVHMKTPANVNYGTQNFFCNNEGPVLVEAAKLMNPASGMITVGSQVKLCHGNNGSVCSQLAQVTGTACAVGSKATLNVTVQDIGNRDVAVKNEKNVNLLRLEAQAGETDTLLTRIVARAAAGSPLNANNYTLWFDSDGDYVVDTILQKGVAAQSNLIRFDSITGGGVVIDARGFVTVEIRADVASSLVDDTLRLELATGEANYVGAEDLDGASLAGVETNGVCNAAPCAINVVTTTSKTYALVSQGDLFVTLDSTPSRSRQLLGGILNETILRMQFRARNEAIDVTDLQITSRGSNASSIDRLELYKDGATTAFATATISGCGSDQVNRMDNGIAVNVFCANMENGQLIIPENENIDVLVKPRMKSDEQGALSGQDIRLFVSQLAVSDNATGRGAIRARGRESSSNLVANDGDSFAEGEVLIGTDTPGPNSEITGSRNVVVLSKIATITNANPDADNTNVPTGISPVGQFRFTAASNANTLNGLNKVSFKKIGFTVSTTNVALDSASFKLYNKADSSSKVPCTVMGGGGSNGTGGGSSVIWTYDVVCSGLQGSAIDAELESGESSTFVLETNVTNAKTSTAASSLQVSFNDFSLAFQPTSDVEWQDKDAGSVGNGTTTSSLFNWFEYSDTVIRSTAYRS